MQMRAMAFELMDLVDAARDADDLAAAMMRITRHLGFDHFALAHHVDLRAARGEAILLHDYPSAWVEYYEANRLGVSDPVHRASHVTSVGFCWSRIPAMIPLTAADHRTLVLGREQGIGDGFTVPANVAGAWTFRAARGGDSFDVELEQTFQNLAGSTAGGAAVAAKLAGDAIELFVEDGSFQTRVTGRVAGDRIAATVARGGTVLEYVGTRN